MQGASQAVLVVKSQPANARDTRDAGPIPGLGRSPGGGNGHPLQNSCLENPMDRGAWWGRKESDITERTRPLPFLGSVTLGKLLNHPGFQFSHLQNGKGFRKLWALAAWMGGVFVENGYMTPFAVYLKLSQHR